MYRTTNLFGTGIRIPMQFFAADGNPPGDAGDGQDGNSPPEITLEQVFNAFKPEDILGAESMRQALDGYTQSAINTAIQNAKAEWDKQKLDDLDEAKKLEKMSAAEREAYKLKKERDEFEKERKAFEHSQLEVTVGSELQKRGLPAEFSKFLTGNDAEESKTRIDEFEKAFNNAVSDALNSKLRGTPPKDGEHQKTFTREQILKMSPEEINKNWEQVSNSL